MLIYSVLADANQLSYLISSLISKLVHPSISIDSRIPKLVRFFHAVEPRIDWLFSRITELVHPSISIDSRIPKLVHSFHAIEHRNSELIRSFNAIKPRTPKLVRSFHAIDSRIPKLVRSFHAIEPRIAWLFSRITELVHPSISIDSLIILAPLFFNRFS